VPTFSLSSCAGHNGAITYILFNGENVLFVFVCVYAYLNRGGDAQGSSLSEFAPILVCDNLGTDLTVDLCVFAFMHVCFTDVRMTNSGNSHTYILYVFMVRMHAIDDEKRSSTCRGVSVQML